MSFLIRIVVNAVALYAASYFVEGVSLEGDTISILIVALVFGLINAVIKPIVKIFSFPFILLSLGLFTLVINALMLMLTDAVSSSLNISGFGAAFFGAIVISIVSWLLSGFTDDDD